MRHSERKRNGGKGRDNKEQYIGVWRNGIGAFDTLICIEEKSISKQKRQEMTERRYK